MSTLDEYAGRYRNVRTERRDGILQITLHDGNGGSLKWSDSAHHDLPLLFRDIADDRENRVVIITGTGDAFIDGGQPGSFQMDPGTPPVGPDRIYQEGKDLLFGLLGIPVPVIAAVNGPAAPHPELALLSDIVLASENATIGDTHFRYGIPPGDGVHVVWTQLLGMNRGRYYLLTGKDISAAEALEWGLVNELLPASDLNSRAWELAGELAQQPVLTLRYTREIITLELKRRFHDELGYGLALEGFASGYGVWR
jgi:enoyl-CoA hydratase/carnithine racemase